MVVSMRGRWTPAVVGPWSDRIRTIENMRIRAQKGNVHHKEIMTEGYIYNSGPRPLHPATHLKTEEGDSQEALDVRVTRSAHRARGGGRRISGGWCADAGDLVDCVPDEVSGRVLVGIPNHSVH